MNAIQKATALGTNDGTSQAREAIEAGHYGQASDWDSGLINAVGSAKLAREWGVHKNSARFRKCLAAYDLAAQTAWDAAAE